VATLCWFLVSLLAWAPQGQADRWILGQHDEEYVRALTAAGFPDLAQLLLERLESTASAGDASQAAALRLDIEQEAALRLLDRPRRREALEQVLAHREEYIASHPGPAADEMLSRQVDLQRMIGELIAEELAQSTSSEQAAELRKRATTMFVKAEKTLNDRLTELRARQEQLPEDATDEERLQLDDDLLLAMYNLARTSYFRALAIDKADISRELTLDRTREILADIQLDFPPDQLVWYESLIYDGLSASEFGKM
jgi:hypothetical protein